MFQDKYFEHFVCQFLLRKRKPFTGEDQNIKHILVCNSLLKNRLKAIANYGFRWRRAIWAKLTLRRYARESEARESIEENVGADLNQRFLEKDSAAINLPVMPTKLANIRKKEQSESKQREKGLLFRVFYHHLFLSLFIYWVFFYWKKKHLC